MIGIIFAIGCRSPFGKALACEAKANLHPLVFYTIKVTSPKPPPACLPKVGGLRLLPLPQATGLIMQTMECRSSTEHFAEKRVDVPKC